MFFTKELQINIFKNIKIKSNSLRSSEQLTIMTIFFLPHLYLHKNVV